MLNKPAFPHYDRSNRAGFQQINRQLDKQETKKSGQDIIQHDPQSPRDPPVEPADRPGLQDIQQAEQTEPCQQPVPALWRHPHRNQETDPLVPDDAAMIMYPEIPGSAATQPDAEQEQ